MLNPQEIKKLISSALEARNFAYTPYSNFKVGAALLTSDGKIYLGCNIENVSFSVTNCAERTALFKAVSEGEKNFIAIAIVATNAKGESVFSYPCGVCRQALLEFCGEDFTIILAKTEEDYQSYTLKEMMPFAFDKGFLN